MVKEKYAAERELVQVAAAAAHDILSPITALDLALQKIPNITNEQREYINKIKTNITNIAKELMQKYKAIKNKKASSALLSGAQDIDHTKNDHYEITSRRTLISNLIKTVFEQKKLLLDEIKIKFTLNINSNALDLNAVVNPDFMQRILSNIINNAADAIMMTERAFSDGEIELALEKHGDEAIITVTDNGCGIPSNLVEKIGKGEYTIGKKEGHGMGLYYAIQHIKKWHGTYSIDTKLNIGTQFKINLPTV